MIQNSFFEARELSLSIEQKSILEKVSFSLSEGEVLAIVGKSGAGKSSLLKILGGLMNPDQGEVFFRGQKLIDPRLQLIRGHNEIKLVNQDYQLDLYHNVEENLRLKLLGLNEESKHELISEVLAVVGLEKQKKQSAITLSGGEQQRLAIARAIIQEPDLLLLDEPFVHLDPQLRVRLETYIQQKIRNWGGSVILVTHDGKEAMSWADKILFLQDAQVKRIDTPEAFYWHPTHYEEALFFGPINEINTKNGVRMFRPNAYSISEGEGHRVKIQSSKFLGTHFEMIAITENEEQIILYSPEEITGYMLINPRFVDEE